ncbi:glycosyltransferase family 39 protein [Candidatus Methylopumilus planktonicus]|nr:glycosyltransferase family 39 protein [Candidatus Methylopumilus planktonicus]
MQSMIKKSHYSLFSAFFFFSLITLITLGTLWQGQYSYDPIHWGLMLSNAKDLFEGKMPYKDIYIQYGFLTTAIHAFSYWLFGKNLFSIIFITGIAYSIGVWLIYLVSLAVSKSLRIALFSAFICFLVHPIAIYPWSNYISFPFFMAGIFFISNKKTNPKHYFLSGLFFGLAILSRETIAPAIILSLILSSLLDYFDEKKGLLNFLKPKIYLVIGLILPIIIFLIYLQTYNLVGYWHKLSWDVPRIFSTILFPGAAGLVGLKNFINNLIGSFVHLNFRWNFFLLLLSVNFFILINKLAKKEKLFNTPCLNLILISSLLGISNSLHIPEIFRLATISSVGVITLFIFLDRYKYLNVIFLLFAYTLSATFLTLNTGNYFYPSSDLRKNAFSVNSIEYFKGQKWPTKTISYYENIDGDLKNIFTLNCGIQYHYNDSEDNFLQVISPFRQYQIAPTTQLDVFNNLRTDLDFKSKITQASDILIFKSLLDSDLANFKIPLGFYVYSKYSTPPNFFRPQNQSLLILIPVLCK